MLNHFDFQSDPELDVGVEWVQLVAKQRVNPNEKQTYAIKCDEILTHVRLTVFPGMISMLHSLLHVLVNNINTIHRWRHTAPSHYRNTKEVT